MGCESLKTVLDASLPSAGNIQFGLGGIGRPYCSFAYSNLACLRTGIWGSASFQS